MSETIPAGLAAAARNVLRANDLGHMTSAAPRLYPHMWSWDSALIAIGLARVSVPRAVVEMRTLLRAQWSTGMIPHIVFSDDDAYFPGPDRWAAELSDAAPRSVRTSGICQPPVHAIAVRAILDAGLRRGGEDERVAREFVESTFGSLVAWHRWLADVRDPAERGLIEIHHGWESGMDNSPRWDAAYAAVTPGPELPPFARHDVQHVADAGERPSDEEYAKYLWLVEQLKSVRYDDEVARDVVDFRVGDVFFSGVLAVACDVLADIGDELGRDAEAREQRVIAARFRAGVHATVSPRTGLARDFDVRAADWCETESIAGFAPLIAGAVMPEEEAVVERQLRLFWGPRWCGHPRLVFPLPPSMAPDAPGMRPRTYWRGPVWPFLNWLFSWALARNGHAESAARLRRASLRQLSTGHFAEYYDPFEATPLGSHDQSWTAAVALDWLAEDATAPTR